MPDDARPDRRTRPSALGRGPVLGGVALALLVALGAWALLVRSAEARLLRASADAPITNRGLDRMALAAGRRVFAQDCAGCHGPNGTGDRSLGAPNLADHDWLYGEGTVSELEQTIAYGIRSHHPKGWNLAEMPAFGRPNAAAAYKIDPLRPAEIADLVAFLRSRRGESADSAAVARGSALYSNRGGCFDCHGGDAAGDAAIGAPNLIDRTWLYGAGSAGEAASIAAGRRGVMPAFEGRLSAVRLRQVALYVHWLSEGAPGKTP